MPLAPRRRLLFLGGLTLSLAACPPGSPTTPGGSVPPLARALPEGPGAAEPEPPAEPLPPGLDTDALAAAGWEPIAVAVLPTDDGSAPSALVAARAVDGSPGAWLVVAHGRPPAEASVLRFAGSEPPIPLWPQPGARPGEWTVVAEQATAAAGGSTRSLPGAWAIDTRGRLPHVEPLWEALESADAVAAVDLEGEGVVELVSVRWHDACPDPLDPVPSPEPGCGPPPPGTIEGCRDEPPADPCLLLRAWSGANGVPRTWRTGLRDGARLASLGDPRLDRVAALLLALDCRYVDLRDMTLRRETGLLAAGEDGELVESVRCLDPAAGPVAATDRRVVLLEAGDGTRVPVGRALSLRDSTAQAGDPAGRWSRGYRLLPDLDGDGVRDWLWQERSAAGTRHVVTRGPDGPAAGTLFVDAGGELVERLVVPPPGGHVRLEALDWRPAPEPAALLDVRLQGPDGATRIERVVVPLEFR